MEFILWGKTTLNATKVTVYFISVHTNCNVNAQTAWKEQWVSRKSGIFNLSLCWWCEFISRFYISTWQLWYFVSMASLLRHLMAFRKAYICSICAFNRLINSICNQKETSQKDAGFWVVCRTKYDLLIHVTNE